MLSGWSPKKKGGKGSPEPCSTLPDQTHLAQGDADQELRQPSEQDAAPPSTAAPDSGADTSTFLPTSASSHVPNTARQAGTAAAPGAAEGVEGSRAAVDGSNAGKHDKHGSGSTSTSSSGSGGGGGGGGGGSGSSDSLPGLLGLVVGYARGVAVAQLSFLWLLATALAGLSCWAGVCLFGFLIVTARYAPASLDYVRPLHFDYTSKDGMAVAVSTLAQGQYMGGDLTTVPALPGARFLPSGQQVELWVEMALPESERNQGVFQLVGELLAGDSRVVARSSRPFMLKHQSSMVKLIRNGFALPWAVLGLYDESVQLRLHLFEAYEERETYPVTYFRATLLPSGGSALPLLYDAAVHIRLKIGFFQRILYWMRPSMMFSWLLASLAVGMLAGGGGCGLVLLVLACVVGGPFGGRALKGKEEAKVPVAPSSASAAGLAFRQLLGHVEDAQAEAHGDEPGAGPGCEIKEAGEPYGSEPYDTGSSWVAASSSRSRWTDASAAGLTKRRVTLKAGQYHHG